MFDNFESKIESYSSGAFYRPANWNLTGQYPLHVGIDYGDIYNKRWDSDDDEYTDLLEHLDHIFETYYT